MGWEVDSSLRFAYICFGMAVDYQAAESLALRERAASKAWAEKSSPVLVRKWSGVARDDAGG